jgi:hypothetical protein
MYFSTTFTTTFGALSQNVSFIQRIKIEKAGAKSSGKVTRAKLSQ